MEQLLKKATRQHTKDHNSRLVLQAIYDAGEISRADLARHTNLTRTTISEVVSGLSDQGLVEEVGQAPPGVGRTPTLLSVIDDARQVVAINVTATELQGALVNLRGVVRHRANLSLIGLDGQAVLEQLYPFLDELVAAARSPLLGLGISAPGLVDTANGIVWQAVNLGWQNLPLRRLLQARYNLPVYVANDCHTLALAAYMFDQQRQPGSLALIRVGQGVGAGLILNGQLFAGDIYGAGEIGHIVVEEHGLPCKCGNIGCLETVANLPALLHRAQLLAQRDAGSLLHQLAPQNAPITIDVIRQALDAGDQGVRQIVTAVGRNIGVGVASLIATLGLRRVIITGRVAPLGQVLHDAITEEVRRRVLPALAQATEIQILPQGRDMALLGAAALLLTNEIGLTRIVLPAPYLEEIAA